MSNVFSLDSLREEVDKEYAPFKIPLSDGSEVTLRSLLRLNEKARDAVLEAVKALGSKQDESEDDEDGTSSVVKTAEQATKLLELIGDRNVKKLIKEIDGDIPLMLQVIKKWMDTTQLGEAENSPVSSTDTASSSSQTSSATSESTSET